MAVSAARKHVEEGYRWVADMDLEKFFDRVNHDVLMSRVARKVTDKRVLLLIRRFSRTYSLTTWIRSLREGDTGSADTPMTVTSSESHRNR